MSKVLQFESFMSVPDIEFWQKLAVSKLEEIGLSDETIEISASVSAQRTSKLKPILRLDGSSMKGDETVKGGKNVRGALKIVNTVEDFKKIDKVKLLNVEGKKLWDDIRTGRAEKETWRLAPFLILTFADLKRHVFLYWFAFPSIAPSVSKTFRISTDPTPFECPNSVSTQLEKIGSPFVFVFRCKDSTVHSLESINTMNTDEYFVGCQDLSANENHPGWIVRNLLVMLSVRYELRVTNLLCYRAHSNKNLLFRNISIPVASDLSSSSFVDLPVRVVGWERNVKGRFGPRKVELKLQMDAVELASTAVDLNLKLMRWRMVPDLNVSKLASTKCLLLGAGTLGCYTARMLLGWGVRHVTFVDSGRVSYSNPVRQPLFNFEDCKGSGKPKAQAAADALRRIFPGVKSRGIMMNIPMPGHPISGESNVKACSESVKQLRDLIDTHDVVFLLTDTRESRWLPTVISNEREKLTFSVALGFDTFVVMRHGHVKQDPKTRLGCYFCNDVVSPTNSTKNRTLDQQCTVTRPGLAAIASAKAVALMVNTLHHPLGAKCPADTCASLTDSSTTPMGMVPHQIRGFLSHFRNVHPIAKHFPKCTACSDIVRDVYRKEGFEFCMRVFNDPKHVENLTGLSELQKSVDMIDVDWDEEDDDF